MSKSIFARLGFESSPKQQKSGTGRPKRRKRSLSRRKLMLEPCEDRNLMAAIGELQLHGQLDSPSRDPNLVVTTTRDSGVGSLAHAIRYANENNLFDPTSNLDQRDVITFDMDVDDARHLFYFNDGVDRQVDASRVGRVADYDSSTLESLIDPDQSSWWSFQLSTALPEITDAVVIDGYSQAGTSQNSSIRVSKPIGNDDDRCWVAGQQCPYDV